MAKRKAPPAPKVWSHLVNGREWEIYLTNGQTLRPVEEIDLALAHKLALSLSVFHISYGTPLRDLTGDASAIRVAFSEVGAKGYEHNTVHLFGSREGTRAVVFDHHH